MAGRRLRPGTAAFIAVSVLALIAAVVAVRGRTPDLMLEVTERTPVFSPDGGPGPREATLAFFLREAEPEARVEVIGSEDEVVRTLEESVGLEAGEELTVTWDGETDAGLPADPDIYRLRVVAPSLERSMIWPRRVGLLRDGRPQSLIDDLRPGLATEGGSEGEPR